MIRRSEKPARKKSVQSCAFRRKHAVVHVSAIMHVLPLLFQDTGVLIFGGYVFSGHCSRQQVSGKMKGYLFSEGYLFTGFYGIVLQINYSYVRPKSLQGTFFTILQPGAVKLVLWRQWMHVIQMHPVTSESQFHCTRLYMKRPDLWILGTMESKRFPQPSPSQGSSVRIEFGGRERKSGEGEITESEGLISACCIRALGVTKVTTAVICRWWGRIRKKYFAWFWVNWRLDDKKKNGTLFQWWFLQGNHNHQSKSTHSPATYCLTW